MLNDRPYMRFRDDYASHVRQGVNTVWALIAINVIVYIIGINPTGRLALWANMFSDAEAYRIYNFAPYQLVTYMFLHGGFSHILFNMWGLYIFGMLVAPILGRTRFLILYFLSGIGGGLLHMLANWDSPVPVVGASGALFGVMMAVAMLRPNVEMFIMFIPVPVKMKTLVVVYALLEIASNYRVDNIAHLAHLGGFVAAYLYLIFFCKKDVVWSLKDIFGGNFRRTFDRTAASGHAAEANKSGGTAPEPHITHVSQHEVDRLLDKISRDGINSLTDYERAELQFFREQMQNRGR